MNAKTNIKIKSEAGIGLMSKTGVTIFDYLSKSDNSAPVFKKINSTPLLIEALDGATNLASAVGGVLKSCFEPNYENWDHKQKSKPTQDILANIFYLMSSGTYSNIFKNVDLAQAVLTQAQIIRFLEKYPRYFLRKFRTSLFITELNGEIFPVEIVREFSGLITFIDQKDCGRVWRAENHVQVICPSGSVQKFL